MNIPALVVRGAFGAAALLRKLDRKLARPPKEARQRALWP